MTFRSCLCASALLLISIASAVAGFATPDAAIKALYASYGLGSESGKNGFDDKLAAQVFDKSLASLYRRAVSSNGLDDDFFVQGNAFSLVKPIEISTVKIEGNRAAVSATLTQNLVGDKTPVRHFLFKLVKTNDGWQMDDAFFNHKSVRHAWADAIKNGD
jgi:hypothetical protein